jgi:hypothetical protein
MSVYGDSSSRLVQQFPQKEVKQVIQLILDSWSSFRTVENKENKITNKFCAHLINNKSRSKCFYTIVSRPAEINEQGEEIGEIDIKIIYRNQEKTYFSFECKRLRVQFPSRFDPLAGKYITEGMYRYFNGQYAQGLDKGGMLGYVMDGNCNEAIKDVQKAVETKRNELYMQLDDTLKASSCVESDRVQETLHRYGPDNKFTIYHIFLPMRVVLDNN